jgi:hypothetical protein
MRTEAAFLLLNLCAFASEPREFHTVKINLRVRIPLNGREANLICDINRKVQGAYLTPLIKSIRSGRLIDAGRELRNITRLSTCAPTAN